MQLTLFLFLIISAGSVFITFLPRRYFLISLSSLLVPFTVLFLYTTARDKYNNVSILFYLLTPFIFILSIKAALVFQPKNKQAQEPISKIHIFSFGVAAALCFFYFASSFIKNPLLWWFIQITTISTLLFITLKYHRPLKNLKRVAYIQLGFLITCTVLVLSNLLFPIYVSVNAALIANNAPYCISVNDKPALSFIDLSIPRMLSKKGRYGYYGSHAILAIYSEELPKIYHWSYTKLSFVGGSSYNSKHYPIACSPSESYAKNLKLLPNNKQSDKFTIMIGGQKLEIPYSYHPRVFQSSSSISIITKGENYLPHNKPLDELSHNEKFRGSIYIKLKNIERINYKKGKRLSFIRKNKDDSVQTTIESWGKNREYRQNFTYNNWLIEFFHDEKCLTEWETCQSRIIDLIKSFKTDK